ncbi:MAG: hypothetical protein GY820_05945 [Gammaproteobacteria bacterium]|nr:hypothetical protein [Gammaproteobacteria bacterium]
MAYGGLMKYFLSRVIEEVLPSVAFIKNKKNIFKKIENKSEMTAKAERYNKLDVDCLSKRIKEEHERAVKIDDKTSKFTLGLSVSLTVLAAASGSFIKFVPDNSHTMAISIVCGISALYMLAAGITALGALKTLPTYGYGTEHSINLMESGSSYLAEAVYAQELMNIIRQLRNEAAYQSLRNGFFMLFFALSASVFLLGNNQIGSMSENNITNLPEDNVENKSKIIEPLPTTKSDNKSIQPTANASAD